MRDKIHEEWLNKDFSFNKIKVEDSELLKVPVRYNPPMDEEQEAELRYHEERKVYEYIKNEDNKRYV